MPGTPRGRVVFLSSPDTLEGSGDRLRSRGVTVTRVVVLRSLSREPGPARPTPPRSRSRLLVVTSRSAVDLYLAPHRDWLATWAPSSQLWAVGPATARALRRLHLGAVRTPSTPGTSGILRELPDLRGAFVFYPRSDRAGPQFGSELRRRGAQVYDPVVYRVAPVARLTRAELSALEDATLLVATSPSTLGALRAASDARTFRRLCRGRSPRLVVLGERSLRSARGHGFRRVLQAPALGEKRFTEFLLGHLSDEREGPGSHRIRATHPPAPVAADRGAPRARGGGAMGLLPARSADVRDGRKAEPGSPGTPRFGPA